MYAKISVWPQGRPKLVVLIVIDQFRADYLSKFESDFKKEGFKALLNQGAYFPYGEYDILQCMTAPGHATILTGSYPYQAGIPLNDWYNQKMKDVEYCVEDANFETVGAPNKIHDGTSPKNLIGTTVGDELKNADLKTRIFSLAIKDRSAILMGGHRADLAFWFHSDAKQWVSSSYYLKNKTLPKWMQKLNLDKSLVTCDLFGPCGVEMTTAAFESMFDGEKIGLNSGTDLVAISFSSHDFVGHRHGANADIMKTMTLAEDLAIAKIRKIIDKKITGGLKNVLFVLTGDHGVAPSPGYLKDTGILSGTINEESIAQKLEAQLIKLCGFPKEGKWIEAVVDFNFFINEKIIPDSKCTSSSIQAEIKNSLLKDERFAHVFSQDDYNNKKLPPGQFARQIEKTFFKGRSGHVIAIQKPFYINHSKNEASHMTGYTYDRMVPIVFSGFGIKPGLYADKAEVVDIAPTLSFILGVLPPALSEGKVLKSALKSVN